MSKIKNYKEIILQGIPLINSWLNKQPEQIQITEDYKELKRVITEIEEEQDYSEQSYLDIIYLLKQFESLSLEIKRKFNVSTMDH